MHTDPMWSSITLVLGPALAPSHSANLRTGPCASPHRQGYLQSSGFYLPDTLRAPALGAEEEVTQGNEYMGTDKKGGRGEGAEAGPQAPEEGGGDEQRVLE